MARFERWQGGWREAPRKRRDGTNRDAGTLSVYDGAGDGALGTGGRPTHPNGLALDAQRNVLYGSVKNGQKDPKDAAAWRAFVARVAAPVTAALPALRERLGVTSEPTTIVGVQAFWV